MNFSALRLPSMALGSAALMSLSQLCSADAAVHRHGPAGAVHHAQAVSVHAGHQTASSGGNRRFARGGTVSVSHRYVSSSHGYQYGWQGASVAGATVVGGSYSSYSNTGGGVGYGYRHHSCRWYYYNEPNNVPSWCGSYASGGPSYTVSYGSTGGYGGYGYSRHNTWSTSHKSASISRVGVTSRVQVASRVHVNNNASHLSGAHGGKPTRMAGAPEHKKVH
jgi:hypothetical protein